MAANGGQVSVAPGHGPAAQVRRILAGYGRGQQPLPVYKMPHLRGWAVAGRHAYLPAIGRHEVLVVDTLRPGKAVLHMEFTPRGDTVWISCRDDHLVRVIDTGTRQTLATLAVDAPSGIFFTARAQRMGF